MKIIESWIDHKENCYAIVKYSKKEQREFHASYEALWLDSENNELCSFAGTIGFRIATFNTLEEAQSFFFEGIAHLTTNPDKWLELLAV